LEIASMLPIVTGAGVVKRGCQLRPVCIRAAGDVGEDAVTAGSAQVVSRDFQTLVRCRHAGMPDRHDGEG
jgi:hypothetical protein